MPLVVFAVFGVEKGPEGIALDCIVPGYGSHVREFVAEGYHLGLVRGILQMVYGRLLAALPILIRYFVRFIRNDAGNPLAELLANLFHGNVGVLYGVVQGCRRQKFLVGGHSSHYLYGFHGMDDVGETLAAALRPCVSVYREDYGAVE